jgi:hypothetical protein
MGQEQVSYSEGAQAKLVSSEDLHRTTDGTVGVPFAELHGHDENIARLAYL